jgi:hypothetical protein
MNYPYVPSGGIILQAIEQFKKALPPKIDAATLKKLGVAPSNEGYVITTLKFLGVADDKNDKTQAGIELFSTHGDHEFAKAFEAVVREKYDALFELRGDEAWELDRDALISFFRGSDKSTAIVGGRQALTFIALAAMAGKRDAPKRATQSNSPKSKAAQPIKSSNAKSVRTSKDATPPAPPIEPKLSNNGDVGLTVRIEINLPANGTQSTYDSIFKSIRTNLLNGNA